MFLKQETKTCWTQEILFCEKIALCRNPLAVLAVSRRMKFVPALFVAGTISDHLGNSETAVDTIQRRHHRLHPKSRGRFQVASTCHYDERPQGSPVIVSAALHWPHGTWVNGGPRGRRMRKQWDWRPADGGEERRRRRRLQFYLLGFLFSGQEMTH
jgi:hypothetical protein